MNDITAVAPRLIGEYVYRCFDRGGQLLYVGVSNDVRNRWKQHRAGSAWFVDAVRFTLTGPFTDRAAATCYEADAIRAESPLHNIQYGRTPVVEGRPRPPIEDFHDASRRSGIPPGTLMKAFDRGYIEDCSTESLMAWMSMWPEMREVSEINARRRRGRAA